MTLTVTGDGGQTITALRRGPGRVRLWWLKVLTTLRYQPELDLDTDAGPRTYRLVMVGWFMNDGRRDSWVAYGYRLRHWGEPVMVRLEFRLVGTAGTVEPCDSGRFR